MEKLEKKRNWFARHKVWTVILVVFGLIVLGSAIGGSSNTSKSTPAAPDNSKSQPAKTDTSPAPAPAAKAAPAPVPTPATPQVLLDLSGKGTKTTQKFTAASDWDLNWSYDCAAFGYQGNFQVYIYNGDGSMSFDNSAVNQLGMKDSGVEHYHKGGTYYLQVNSECSWTMQAKG
jgi:cell division septation protein DedD